MVMLQLVVYLMFFKDFVESFTEGSLFNAILGCVFFSCFDCKQTLTRGKMSAVGKSQYREKA